MKDLIVSYLFEELKDHMDYDSITRSLDTPPSEDMGDFAFPCFPLARIFRKKPQLIAEDLKNSLEGKQGVSKIAVVSGFLNFYIDRKELAVRTLEAVQEADFGSDQVGRTIMLEFSSPNTNKPLHLGHLRNIALGDCLARVNTFLGNRVIKSTINNDRGIHICKSMLAYQKWGKNSSPETAGKKSDHFVGDYYVLFNNKLQEEPDLEDQARELLRKWEAEDQEIRDLWRTMNTWAFNGFDQTYALFGVEFDRVYFESEIYKSGKEIVLAGLERGTFTQKTDGAVVVDLEAEKLGEKVLLRSDGTAIYIVQDLFLAETRFDEYAYDSLVYVVGNEQEYHFRVLFAILKKLDKSFADRLFHLSYGMVELPEGKMKSREGTVVDADDLIAETQKLSLEELKKRYDLPEKTALDRSLKITLAAIKYHVLKVDYAKNILFNPREAIRFEGDTGPYLLYSYARAASILRKTGDRACDDIREPNEFEARLLKKLGEFPEVTRTVADKLLPSALTGYGFELAQTFNEFYHNCPVLRGENPGFRVALVKGFKSVMKRVLNLMGIDEIEEM